MTVPTTVSKEDAVRFMRVVEPDEQLGVIEMAPMAGNSHKLANSLAGVEAFLKPISSEEAAAPIASMRIHYVDPGALASWVRNTIGDAELATILEEVIATGNAFGLLVPEMKRLIADRIAQYRAVLDENA